MHIGNRAGGREEWIFAIMRVITSDPESDSYVVLGCIIVCKGNVLSVGAENCG